MEELVVGVVIGPWILMRHLPPVLHSGHKNDRWLVKCSQCKTLQRRLSDHLSLNVQPGCGRCRTKAGVVYVGTEAKKRVAARSGNTITDIEAWALDNCDDNLEAQAIVDVIIKRETTKIRAAHAAANELAIRAGEWVHYNQSRKLDVIQVSAMEDDDDFVADRE